MRVILMFTMIISAVFVPALHPSVAARDLSDQARSVLTKLSESSGGTLEVKWDENTGTPAVLAGRLSRPSKHTPQWIAYEFLNQTKTLYGLKNPNKDMEVVEVDQSSGSMIRVRFQRLLFGVPVWGDGLTIKMDKQGVITLVEGRIYPYLEKKLFNRQMHPSLSANKAAKVAMASVQGAGTIADEPKVESYYLPTRPGTPLVYVVTLHFRAPEYGVRRIFVHGLTGRVIDQKTETVIGSFAQSK